MVLKSHKGIYMQLENGKIVAIKTPPKQDENGADNGCSVDDNKIGNSALRNNSLVHMGSGGPVVGGGRIMSRLPTVDRNINSMTGRRGRFKSWHSSARDIRYDNKLLCLQISTLRNYEIDLFVRVWVHRPQVWDRRLWLPRPI